MNEPKEHILEVSLPAFVHRALEYGSDHTGIPTDILARIAITRLLQELKEEGKITAPAKWRYSY
jgi:hypothetical protein